MTHRILTTIEVIAVFLLGSIIGSKLTDVVGIRSWIIESNSILTGHPIDFQGLASREVVQSFFKYGTIFTIVSAILIFLNRSDWKKTTGITIPSYPLRKHLRVILLVVVVGGFIPKSLFALYMHGYIKGGPVHWSIFHENWDMGFWQFMLAGSIIIPPIVEELFFRGYMQGRLELVFKPGYAMIITAVIFTLFHIQYLRPDLLSISLLLCLFLSAMVLSYSRYITGSIFPGIMAHALVNIPFCGISAILWIGIAIFLILLWRRKIFYHLKNLLELITP